MRAEVGAAEVEAAGEAVVPLVPLAPPTAGSVSVPALARVLVPAQLRVRAPAGQPPIQLGTKTATKTVTETAIAIAIVSLTNDLGDHLATPARKLKAPLATERMSIRDGKLAQ
jgi:hypothetical protein